MTIVRCALGIDPGFASMGYALVELGRASDRVVKMGVFETKKDTKKSTVLAANDNLRRCSEMAMFLEGLLRERSVVCFCVESMSFPRNASTAAKIAMCWGVISALAAVHQVSISQCSPQMLKKNLCGARDASKEDVQAALTREFPYLPGLVSSLAKSKHEHAFDALGAIVGVRDSDVLRLARSML